MAAKTARDESLGARWEFDIACVDLGGAALDLTGKTIHHRLVRNGEVVLDRDSGADADNFAIQGDASAGNVRVITLPADQDGLPGGVVYEEEIWVSGAGGPWDQIRGSVHVMASAITAG